MVSCNLSFDLEGNGMHAGSSLSCQCLERERQGRSQSCSSFSTSEPDMLESPVVRNMTREMIKICVGSTGFFNISPFRLPLEMLRNRVSARHHKAMNHRHSRSSASMGSSCGFTLWCSEKSSLSRTWGSKFWAAKADGFASKWFEPLSY